MAEYSTILGRRDVALVPCVALVVISAAAALSASLRPDPSDVDHLAAVVGGLLAVLCSVLALGVETPLAQRMRGRVSTYLLGTGGVIVGLMAIAIADGGLSSPYFYGTVLAGAYLGLVLPQAASGWALAGLILAACTVQVANPAGSTSDGVSVVVLIAAGWCVGALGNRAHTRAARVALSLSRSDVLTATLNRRGFFEEFTHQLARAEREEASISLLLMDLDDFKPINDTYGHSAGDELLRWVGQQLADLAPPGASVGRMGGDEFAMSVPGAGAQAARRLAADVSARIAARIGVSVGVSSYHPGDAQPDADDLVRAADLELYAVKGGPGSGVGRGGPIARVAAPARAMVSERVAPPPPLTYAAFRSRREVVSAGAADLQSYVFPLGYLTIAVAGAIIFAALLAAKVGSDDMYAQILQYAAGPWVLANLGFSWFFHRRDPAQPPPAIAAIWAPSVLIGCGICIVVLAGNDLANPVVLALALKVMYDAFSLRRRDAFLTMVLALGFWTVAAALGPPETLWIAPFQLAIIASTFALGFVANRAFTEATEEVLGLAHTDALTGLHNRQGFDAAADRALDSALRGSAGFAILVFDLDDFKGVNDALGHAAGDELLRQVAATVPGALPDAIVTARIGGDEFATIIPATDYARAGRAAGALSSAMAPYRPASIGFAVFGEDGTDIETLLRAADIRAYAVKRGRKDAVVDQSPPADCPC